MHKIFFYRDRNGNEPVFEYLKELTAKTDKNSRINANTLKSCVCTAHRPENLISSIWMVRYGSCDPCEIAYSLLRGRGTVMCFYIISSRKRRKLRHERSRRQKESLQTC